MKQLVKFMIDISMGMHYLAEKGLVHRVSHVHHMCCVSVLYSVYMQLFREYYNYVIMLIDTLVFLIGLGSAQHPCGRE